MVVRWAEVGRRVCLPVFSSQSSPGFLFLRIPLHSALQSEVLALLPHSHRFPSKGPPSKQCFLAA